MPPPFSNPLDALRRHWPEYIMEGAELGLFMVSACLFGLLIYHPAAPAARAIDSDFIRRFLIGVAMGLTAVAIICSPLGQRSGAHMNPAVTLAFLRLGKVRPWDAIFYIVAQFLGAITGVLLVSLAAGGELAHPAVRHVSTSPGASGASGLVVAWFGEFTISFILMSVVLVVSNRVSLARLTPLFAGSLVWLFIVVEAPISGMSVNPARTFGSAFWSHVWTGLWVYFTAPPLAMLAAAEVHVRLRGAAAVHCAKLHHFNRHRCIFHCSFDRMAASGRNSAVIATPVPSNPLRGNAHVRA
jgi:aquaporin Z